MLFINPPWFRKAVQKCISGGRIFPQPGTPLRNIRSFRLGRSAACLLHWLPQACPAHDTEILIVIYWRAAMRGRHFQASAYRFPGASLSPHHLPPAGSRSSHKTPGPVLQARRSRGTRFPDTPYLHLASPDPVWRFVFKDLRVFCCHIAAFFTFFIIKFLLIWPSDLSFPTPKGSYFLIFPILRTSRKNLVILF